MTAEPMTPAIRLLTLITTPKLAVKAAELFRKSDAPLEFSFEADGTASSEVMDLLGLGSTEKTVLVSMMPKPSADEMLKKLHKTLRIGAVNSGIAFTMPVTGMNKLILQLLTGMRAEAPAGKGENVMSESIYTLIGVVVNQGYTEDVMKAARAAGASGGTVFHTRRVGDPNAVQFWGMSAQEEKETVLILADIESKLAIMKAIGEHCGVCTDANGIILSMPVDNVIGLD